MSRDLDAIIGKEFVHPTTHVRYGSFRVAEGTATVSTLDGRSLPAIAEDESGNYVTTLPDGSVWFWDHETDALEKLAESTRGFVAGCSDPEPVRLEPSQVDSAWLDPDLVRSLGVKVPRDGWIKRKS